MRRPLSVSSSMPGAEEAPLGSWELCRPGLCLHGGSWRRLAGSAQGLETGSVVGGERGKRKGGYPEVWAQHTSCTEVHTHTHTHTHTHARTQSAAQCSSAGSSACALPLWGACLRSQRRRGARAAGQSQQAEASAAEEGGPCCHCRCHCHCHCRCPLLHCCCGGRSCGSPLLLLPLLC